MVLVTKVWLPNRQFEIAQHWQAWYYSLHIIQFLMETFSFGANVKFVVRTAQLLEFQQINLFFKILKFPQ